VSAVVSRQHTCLVEEAIGYSLLSAAAAAAAAAAAVTSVKHYWWVL
jgi:hypothetical protein